MNVVLLALRTKMMDSKIYSKVFVVLNELRKILMSISPSVIS